MCAESSGCLLILAPPKSASIGQCKEKTQQLLISPGWVQEICKTATGLVGYSPFLSFLSDFLKFAEFLRLQCCQGVCLQALQCVRPAQPM